jgi:hypothetical protein
MKSSAISGCDDEQFLHSAVMQRKDRDVIFHGVLLFCYYRTFVSKMVLGA